MSIDLGNYNDVAGRLTQFRTKHPEGSLQPLNPAKPFEIVTVEGRTFVAVVVAAYRTPDDPHPGVGMAWEPFPGKTPYTKDSELQNAETSAWGRAMVAALAADTKAGIASADEVRNRRADDDIDPRTGSVRTTATRPAQAAPTRAPAQPPAATATPSAVTAPVTAPADDDPFRPFDEHDELLAGPLWARQFAVAMTASNWGPKTVAAVIRYATGGRTGDPRSVLRTEAAKVATTQRRLDAGELAEDSDGHLVEVRASHGPGAAA